MVDIVESRRRLTYVELQSLTEWPSTLVNDYHGQYAFNDSVVAALRSLTPQNGEDSPEGNVTSNANGFYFDTVGQQLYYNPVEGSASGWVAV